MAASASRTRRDSVAAWLRRRDVPGSVDPIRSPAAKHTRLARLLLWLRALEGTVWQPSPSEVSVVSVIPTISLPILLSQLCNSLLIHFKELSRLPAFPNIRTISQLIRRRPQDWQYVPT